MKIRYRKVLLEKNERFSTPLTIPVWEVPVLMEAHASSLITDLGEVLVERKEAPEAAAEFQRLVNRYKHGENSEVPYVARVFGVSALAVKVLDRLIREATVVEGAAGAEAPLVDSGEPESQEISDLSFVTGAPEEGVEEITSP